MTAPRAIILAPTRELAGQIAREFDKLTNGKKFLRSRRYIKHRLKESPESAEEANLPANLPAAPDGGALQEEKPAIGDGPRRSARIGQRSILSKSQDRNTTAKTVSFLKTTSVVTYRTWAPTHPKR